MILRTAMWQLFALGAVLTEAAESVFDKAAVVKNIRIDSLIATFWRPLLYTALTMSVGLTGVIGHLHFFFRPSLLVVALFGSCTSLFYTYILKRVEITSANAIGYLAPILFLFIDTHLAHISLTVTEVTGVVLLVMGGIAFTMDGSVLRFKKELTPLVWGMFLFNLAYGAADAYIFKYFNSSYGVNGVSFFFSVWLLSSAYLLAVVIWKGKGKLLFNHTARQFIVRAFAGKSFDAINTVLWAQALTLAAVSQVSAFGSTYPLVLFLLVLLFQGLLQVPLGERIDLRRVPWKTGATILLVAGGYMAS